MFYFSFVIEKEIVLLICLGLICLHLISDLFFLLILEGSFKILFNYQDVASQDTCVFLSLLLPHTGSNI